MAHAMSPPRARPTLGQRIRERRVERETGLRELARRIEITPSYASDIENDRRVPAEEVLRSIAKELELPFDELMALGGRLDVQTEEYLKRQPTAGVLFRRISARKLGAGDIKTLLDQAEKLPKKAAE